MPLSAKLTNYTSSNSPSGVTSQSISSNSSSMMIRAKASNNINISDPIEDSKPQKTKNSSFCAISQSSNLTLNNGSAKPNILQKQSVLPKLSAVHSISGDNDVNGVKSEITDTKANNSE